MKKLVLTVAALLLASAAVPAAFAGDWFEGKYEAGHHYTWDEWRDHRTAWEAEHKGEKHWDEKMMRREWEGHKNKYHY
jgi:hypothetical protein